jgi:hypothetical protein
MQNLLYVLDTLIMTYFLILENLHQNAGSVYLSIFLKLI